MTSLHDAVEVNLDAIYSIQTQCERDAITGFDFFWPTFALQLPVDLMEATAEAEAVAAAQLPDMSTPSPFDVYSVATDDFMSGSVFENTEWSRPAEPPQSFFSIFNRAFEFHIDPNTTTTTTTTRMSRRAAWVRCASNLPTVMMYNEGLAYHILAQRDDSPVLFNAALQYYLQSYNSMVQQSSVFQYDSEMDILFMALTNNMGRCFGRLHDIGRMMWCYNELLAMYSSSTNKHNLTKEEQEFFQQRILHGNDYQLRPSAAA